MFFQHARKSVAGTLAAAVLAATPATTGCTSVTRKDVWKPEKEFSETVPAGESTQERLAYEISATHSASNASALEVVVQEAKYQEQYKNFQMVGKVREKKWVEETKKDITWVVFDIIALTGLLGVLPTGLYMMEEKGDKETGGNVAGTGAIMALLGLVGMLIVIPKTPEKEKGQTYVHPTDELRISQKSQRTVANKTGQQTIYTAKPAASIEVIAESDFYAVNGSGRTSVYTGADGRANLLIGLPRGYVATEQELMQELMRRAEAGSMPLSEIRGYKTRAQVEHAIRLCTNAQQTDGTAVDNAKRTIPIPAYKLP